MNDIEQKALAVLNEVRKERDWRPITKMYRSDAEFEPLCRAIERHEAFKQEVSDALEEYKADQPYVWKQSASDYFDRFIIIKPDPLVGVAESLGYFNTAAQGWAGDVRAALEARGLEIREKPDANPKV